MRATGARHYLLVGVDASVDLNEKGDWTGDASYAHTHSTIDSESVANQGKLGFDHELDDVSSIEGGLDFWNDSTNKIHYAGPTFGYSYVPVHALGFTLGADLFFYSSDVPVAGSGQTLRRRNAPATSATHALRTTQLRTGLELEQPLFGGALTPFAGASHYFYSADPAQIEAAAGSVGLRLGTAFSSSIDALAGGFLKNTFDLGATYAFAPGSKLRAEFGRQQSATDNSWSTTYGSGVTQRINDTWRARLAWSHAAQQDHPVDYFTLAVTYFIM